MRFYTEIINRSLRLVLIANDMDENGSKKDEIEREREERFVIAMCRMKLNRYAFYCFFFSLTHSICLNPTHTLKKPQATVNGSLGEILHYDNKSLIMSTLLYSCFILFS